MTARRSARLGRPERGDLQLPGAPDGTRSARAPLPDAVRYRGAARRLCRARRRLPVAAPRHVRVRPVGRRAAPAPARARSPGQEAALLPSRRATGSRSPPSRRPSSPSRPSRRRRPWARCPTTSRTTTSRRPGSAFAGRPAGAAGALPPRGGRPGAARAVLAAPLPAEAPAVGGRRGGRAPGAAPGRRAVPARRRRSARRVPERRDRLERRRGAHGRGRRGPGPDLLDRIRGARVRRAPVRAAGRAPATARSTTSSSSGRRRSTSCPGWSGTTTSPTRIRRRSRPSIWPSSPGAT